MSPRCPRCALPVDVCLCAVLPCLEVRTELHVLRHVREEDKLSNSARVAALALPSLRLHRYGQQGPRFDATPLLGPGTALLYPLEAGGPEADPTRVRRLVVVDGTWAQTRRMVRRVPGLLELPRLRLPPDPPAPRRRLRRPTTPEGLSTLEALAAALEVLEGPVPADALREAYERLAERVWWLRGRALDGGMEWSEEPAAARTL